jgi:hypothetical protein
MLYTTPQMIAGAGSGTLPELAGGTLALHWNAPTNVGGYN